ncbi:MAG TPA: translation initiation factor IF-3 [Candidatus Limnocylindria bacterium]|nr:translation initiation factor IF-3 [Candidatus Limnocylindria bacterium]
MSRPFPPRSSWNSGPTFRVNGKIRSREVRVIGIDGQQLGILQLSDAIRQAQALGVDLVEIAPNATPPVCRIVDFGKFRYEQAKKDKESKKHQHANKVKEVQLSPQIDPHDFGVKLNHAIDFLAEDMKVKVTLKFRGREMAHKEFGFQQVQKFMVALAPWGHPDFEPKLIGKGINAMISPLPRNKRAKHPRENGEAPAAVTQNGQAPERPSKPLAAAKTEVNIPSFANNPFAELDASKVAS